MTHANTNVTDEYMQKPIISDVLLKGVRDMALSQIETGKTYDSDADIDEGNALVRILDWFEHKPKTGTSSLQAAIDLQQKYCVTIDEDAIDIIAQTLAEAEARGRNEISAYEFITNGDAKMVLNVLGSAQCKSCGGSGERNDADLGDVSYDTWACTTCSGKGWDKQAVQEIINAVEPPKKSERL